MIPGVVPAALSLSLSLSLLLCVQSRVITRRAISIISTALANTRSKDPAHARTHARTRVIQPGPDIIIPLLSVDRWNAERSERERSEKATNRVAPDGANPSSLFVPS